METKVISIKYISKYVSACGIKIERNGLLMEKVRLGIIGYGQQGGFYGSLIKEGRVDGMVLGAITKK